MAHRPHQDQPREPGREAAAPEPPRPAPSGEPPTDDVRSVRATSRNNGPAGGAGPAQATRADNADPSSGPGAREAPGPDRSAGAAGKARHTGAAADRRRAPEAPDDGTGQDRPVGTGAHANAAARSEAWPPRPTSRDVARVAGVSQATVSLVLGDKWRGRVSERTARLVRDAAQELGYRPNLAARSLRLGRTRTALLVVPALTNEFFARVYAGAAAVAAEHDFGVVLYPSPGGTGPAKDPFASARASLDGVIASSMAAEALTAIHGTDLPLVMLDSDPADPGAAAHVNLDIADGMRQMADHLVALGHRRFVHLASAVPSWTFDVRARALHEALRAVPDAVVRTVPASLDVDGGREAAERALTAAGPRPTAIVCDDDILAAGA